MKRSAFRLARSAAALGLILAGGAGAADHAAISSSLESVTVQHQGQPITIERSADPKATVPESYSKVSHPCPPFCIQPAHIDGVETVAELEVLDALSRIAKGDSSLLVVDSRTPEWMARGTIPGSVNVPWSRISQEAKSGFEVTSDGNTLADTLKGRFGATQVAGHWDFAQAKTLVLFCNGAWCPQSAANIHSLLKLGYPAAKLKWYRGGMQDWVTLGLTTVH